MSSIFISRVAAVKTKEQKRVSRKAKAINTRVKDSRKPGVCVTLYKKED